MAGETVGRTGLVFNAGFIHTTGILEVYSYLTKVLRAMDAIQESFLFNLNLEGELESQSKKR